MAKGRVRCGPAEAFVFLAALACGTGCSLTSKILLDVEAMGEDGEVSTFSKPIFQTFAMFLAMLAALPFHWTISYFQIPFPGYNHKIPKKPCGHPLAHDHLSPPKMNYNSFQEEAVESVAAEGLSREMYLMLMFPAIFDLTATALCMFGLQYINVSSYQLLRGSSIVFVALMKNFWIGDRLKNFMWIGVGWNLISIVLVGATTFFEGGNDVGTVDDPNRPLMGVALILAGAVVQSLQYAFEEHAMSGQNVSPMLLVGMEGFWGGLVCAFIIYPTVYLLPGNDHGSFEDPINTFYMIQNNSHLQLIIAIYVVFIFGYNLMCVILTCMLDSVWHAILDNFRPITVWGIDLLIFYLINVKYGEEWTTWSFLQLTAMGCLLYGTGLYNAPNPGSIKLIGRPQDCFIDCTKEYEEIAAEHHGEVPIMASPYMSPFQTGRRKSLDTFDLDDKRGLDNRASSRAHTQYRRNSE